MEASNCSVFEMNAPATILPEQELTVLRDIALVPVLYYFCTMIDPQLILFYFDRTHLLCGTRPCSFG